MCGIKYGSKVDRYFCFLILSSTCVSAAPILSSWPLRHHETYTPLIVSCLVFFLVFVACFALKVIYLKHRRIGTIHSPSLFQSYAPNRLRSNLSHDISSDYNSGSSLIPQFTTEKRAGKCNRPGGKSGILVGCLGSPVWETRIKFKIDSEVRKTQSANFVHPQQYARDRHQASETGSSNRKKRPGNRGSNGPATRSVSFFSFSSEHNLEDSTEPGISGSLRTISYPTKFLNGAVDSFRSRRNHAPNRGPLPNQVGDFGENIYPWDDQRIPASRGRRDRKRTTTSWDTGVSLRLVGPSESTHAPLSFLSGCPSQSSESSHVTSPRDSLQLPRLSSRLHCAPIPPLPPLPLSSMRRTGISSSKSPSTDAPELPISPPKLIPPLQFSPTSTLSSFPASPIVNQPDVPVQDSDKPTLSSPLRTHQLPITPGSSVDDEYVQPRPLSLDLALIDRMISSPRSPIASNPSQKTPLIFAVQKLNRKKSKTSRKSRNGSIVGASPLRSMLVPPTAKNQDRKENPNPFGDSVDQETHIHGWPVPPTSANQGLRPLNPSLWRTNPIRRIASPGVSVNKTFNVPTQCPQSSDVSSGGTPILQTPGSDRSSVREFADRFEDVDIGLLGLDRFYWSEEGEEPRFQPSHIKNDSSALISFWEEGGWLREHDQLSDVGLAQ
ncbi:hypothetical protein BJ138DRAFT_1150882 [Hygrophoropsis aurantiaca]|uniref:Uncharacterized protein n=1 Tax=Hygrophoropsis aurantiaca TaxID=72124 RepID=A0ACB8AE68_9AGAM|nr:hypothetical protein BJ138DRAFT_1150882 [Hygrophoropsis aurantiaca]